MESEGAPRFKLSRWGLGRSASRQQFLNILGATNSRFKAIATGITKQSNKQGGASHGGGSSLQPGHLTWRALV